MRCFLMKGGSICAVAILLETEDANRITEAHKIFESKGPAIGADGFEIWDRSRFVYRFAASGTAQPEAATPAKLTPHWFVTIMRQTKSKFAVARLGAQRGLAADQNRLAAA